MCHTGRGSGNRIIHARGGGGLEYGVVVLGVNARSLLISLGYENIMF